MGYAWLDGVAILSFCWFVGSTIFGWNNFTRTLAMLREKHPDTWKDLGCPRVAQIAGPSSVNSQTRLRRYFEQRDYLRTCDSAFIALCNRSRRYMYLQVAGFMGFVFSALAISLMK